MARKATKQVEEEEIQQEETQEEAPKKTTKRASSKKSTKKHKITFRPQFTAAESKTVLLRDQKTIVVGNTTRAEYVPIIDGLPLELTINKDEIVEVTDEQLKALMQLGFIDTDETIEAKKTRANEIERQLRESPESAVATALSSVYRDNFYLVE